MCAHSKLTRSSEKLEALSLVPSFPTVVAGGDFLISSPSCSGGLFFDCFSARSEKNKASTSDLPLAPG